MGRCLCETDKTQIVRSIVLCDVRTETLLYAPTVVLLEAVGISMVTRHRNPNGVGF